MTEEEEIIELREEKKQLALMLNAAINFISRSDISCPKDKIANCGPAGMPCYDCYVSYFKELTNEKT